MSAAVDVPALEFVQTHGSTGDGVCHMVCHCTDDDESACRLDVSEVPWGADDEPWCPLCAMAWPDGSPTCPWGCDCADECGPAEPTT